MITVKISKAVLADPARLRAVNKPLALARVMAESVQERVMVRGVTATAPKPYAAHVVQNRRTVTTTASGAKTKKGYVISPAYATAAGIDRNRFDSSADMHAAAGVKPGTYRVTGQMWKGLQVRTFGDGAVIEFAGVSLGSTSKPRFAWQRRADGKMAPRRSKAGDIVLLKPKNVRNWEKAGTVFKHSRINVVQPTDTETRDMIDGLGARLFDAIQIVTTDALRGSDLSVLPRTALARKFYEALDP